MVNLVPDSKHHNVIKMVAAVEATTDSARVRGHAQNAVKAMQFRPKFARRGGQQTDDVMMNYLYPLDR